MNDFSGPAEIDDMEIARSAGVHELMPAHKDIPDEFKRDSNPWVNWQREWFLRGLTSFPEVRDGIDPLAARRHLSAIQGSFESPHEHKEAAIAYLASLWLKEPSGIRARS